MAISEADITGLPPPPPPPPLAFAGFSFAVRATVHVDITLNIDWNDLKSDSTRRSVDSTHGAVSTRRNGDPATYAEFTQAMASELGLPVEQVIFQGVYPGTYIVYTVNFDHANGQQTVSSVSSSITTLKGKSLGGFEVAGTLVLLDLDELPPRSTWVQNCTPPTAWSNSSLATAGTPSNITFTGGTGVNLGTFAGIGEPTSFGFDTVKLVPEGGSCKDDPHDGIEEIMNATNATVYDTVGLPVTFAELKFTKHGWYKVCYRVLGNCILESTQTAANAYDRYEEIGGLIYVQPHADVGAPVIVGFSPLRSASMVLPTSSIVLTFDEPVQAGIGEVTFKVVRDGREYPDENVVIYVPDSQVSVSGATVTVRPSGGLSTRGNEFRVDITPGTIQDFCPSTWYRGWPECWGWGGGDLGTATKSPNDFVGIKSPCAAMNSTKINNYVVHTSSVQIPSSSGIPYTVFPIPYTL